MSNGNFLERYIDKLKAKLPNQFVKSNEICSMRFDEELPLGFFSFIDNLSRFMSFDDNGSAVF